MKKISEILDLSKKVLDIDIESPVFSAMLKDLDKEIQRIIKSVYDGEFASGEISLKLNLEIFDAVKEIPKVDDCGDMVKELYRYKKPSFEHKITSTLKKQYNQKGCYSENREVIWDDIEEKYVVQPLIDPQIKFNVFDSAKEEGQENE